MTDYQNILNFVVWKFCSIGSSRPHFPAWQAAVVGEASKKWMQENNIKGEHIYLTHTEWLQLCEKFQFNAVPFCLAVDKDGNIVTYDDLDNAMNNINKDTK